ncbi:hypothetical protein CCMSSC00406_0004698 [Pleurotus cornucopiae]|uniref:Uncharacterized protein n=1 Tax=Pleurotus cornucopiae TaxID=5321 RepID=A0ACB7J2Z7_PLECO|nr:hypothetical protein CCMSSC00406_0004698 [Pleurotus cornucopiae]
MPTFDELQSPANILTEIQHGSPSDAPKTPADKNPFDILSPPPTPSACYSSNSEESSQELTISSNCEHPLSPSDSVVLDPTNPSLIQTLSKPMSLEPETEEDAKTLLQSARNTRDEVAAQLSRARRRVRLARLHFTKVNRDLTEAKLRVGATRACLRRSRFFYVLGAPSSIEEDIQTRQNGAEHYIRLRGQRHALMVCLD